MSPILHQRTPNIVASSNGLAPRHGTEPVAMETCLLFSQNLSFELDQRWPGSQCILNESNTGATQPAYNMHYPHGLFSEEKNRN
jgi:hypothetical protein